MYIFCMYKSRVNYFPFGLDRANVTHGKIERTDWKSPDLVQYLVQACLPQQAPVLTKNVLFGPTETSILLHNATAILKIHGENQPERGSMFKVLLQSRLGQSYCREWYILLSFGEGNVTICIEG